MKRMFLSALLVVLAATLPVRGDDSKKDQEKLQGTWQATEAVGNGKPLPKEDVDRIKMVFSGEQMDFFPYDGDGTQSLHFTFKLDTSHKPRAIDLTRLRDGVSKESGKAIYQLDGDTLRVCFPAKQDEERPTAFASPQGSELILITLKRSQATEAAPNRGVVEQPGSPEQAALEFVIAAILNGDVAKAGEYIADHASRNEREYAKGELRERLCKELSGIPRDRVTLRQIRFFRKGDIDRIRKEFPEDLFDRFGWDNFSERLSDDLACLLVLTNKDEPILIGMVFKNVDGRYQFVHTEDN